ncbi:hypothetical protein [Paraburkholderia sacchari]|uniref:hypothetical protein n=1 Tax=Paraburkholderia sacchari TaxID=159450 RepID=UPI002F26AE9B
MGSNHHYPEEAPAHKVSVRGFWMDRHAVTNSRSCPTIPIPRNSPSSARSTARAAYCIAGPTARPAAGSRSTTTA